jgi:alkylation response protein AidB-like acyl-CoA dehydrogenase
MTGAWQELTATLRQHRRPDAFPVAAFAELSDRGLLDARHIAQLSERAEAGPPPLFDLLVAIGRGDLAVGRLWEGHVDALGLVTRLGTAAQRDRVAAIAARGGLLGVWGADDFRAPGRLDASNRILSGRKTYASGADQLALAIVLVRDPEERGRLVMLERDRLDGRFDPSWWRPMGMEATRSALVNLEGIEIAAEDLLGEPDRYFDQPAFGGGAVRFVAVQLGGMLAVWDAMRDHLIRTERHENPHQAARLGRAVGEAEAAFLYVRDAYTRLADGIGFGTKGDPADAVIADAARMFVEGAAERLCSLALHGVGCAGLMEGHELERALRDLTVYLRQPAPDAAITRLGSGAATQHYRPAFDAY